MKKEILIKGRPKGQDKFTLQLMKAQEETRKREESKCGGPSFQSDGLEYFLWLNFLLAGMR